MRRFVLSFLILALLLVASPAWATFPTEGTATLTDTAVGTSHVVNLPTCASGNLFVVVGILDGSVTAVSWPGSWVELLGYDDAGAVDTAGYLFSTGGESTVTVTSTGSDDGAWIAWCITGAHASQAPELTFIDNGATSTPDPPQETASWGAEDNLWITCVGNTTGAQTITSYPANYTNSVDNQGAGNRVSCATRQLNAASEDPGTFTLSGSTGSKTTWTIVVRPAAVVASRGCGGFLLFEGGC